MDLLGDHDLVDKCLAQCGLHRHQVEDICPATPFQQMLAKDAVAVAAWSYQCVFEVIGDTERAISAFQLVLAGNAILRTRLVRPDPVDAKTYQVVEHPSNDRITKVDIGLDDYIRRDQAKRIAYGQPLTRLALVTNSGKNYIVLSWTHCQYDGVAKRQLLLDLRIAIEDPESFNASARRPQFTLLAQSIHDRARSKAATEFWAARLSRSSIESRPTSEYAPARQGDLSILSGQDLLQSSSVSGRIAGPSFYCTPSTSLYRIITCARPERTTITLATLTHLAWALTLANTTGSADVFFANFTDHRSTSKLSTGVDLSSALGPQTSMTPFRLALGGSMKIRDLAENVQQDLALALPHAPWGPEAFERYTRGRLPPTLLVQQGSDTDQSELNMEATAQSGGQTHALRSRPDLWTKISLPFAICAMLVPVEKDKVMIWTRHDGRVIDEDGMVRLIDDFEQMVVGVAESLGEDGGGSGSTTVAEVCPAAFA